MEAENINSESEVLEQAAQGNYTAMHSLVFDIYVKPLSGTIVNVLKNSDDFKEELERNKELLIQKWLCDFYFYLVTPKKRDGKLRLSNINTDKNPQSYLCNAMENYILDEMRKTVREAAKRVNITQEIPNSINRRAGQVYENKELKEKHINALVMALESLKEISVRDRYILITYLICERYRGQGGPLYISRHIAQQLGIKESTVKMAYKRQLERLQKKAKKFL